VAHNIFADHLDIFYMYAEMGNDELTEMQLKFQDSPNPSLFITSPTVGGTGLNLTAANHAVITQKVWVLNEQCQAFARVVRLGQNRVPHTWLLNTGPSGYDNRASDLHQLSALRSGTNESPAWTDEPTEYHDFDDIPDSGVS
jgi:hypothetical protein